MERTELDQTRAPIYEALEKFREMRVVPFDVRDTSTERAIPSSRLSWARSASVLT